MSSSSSQIDEQLIRALQNTLVQVEASAGVAPDDPALVALKGIVLQRIADLQLARAEAATVLESGESPMLDATANELSTEAA